MVQGYLIVVSAVLFLTVIVQSGSPYLHRRKLDVSNNDIYQADHRSSDPTPVPTISTDYYFTETASPGYCTYSYCMNGGTCIMERGQPRCLCGYRYFGVRCEKDFDPIVTEIVRTSTGRTSTAPESSTPDFCAIYTCFNGGICVMERGRPRCNCRYPYFGLWCEKDPCYLSPCLNGGTCFIDEGLPKCRCKNINYGKWCEEASTTTVTSTTITSTVTEPVITVTQGPCSINPCQNGGMCFENGNAFKCFCNIPFYGDTCENGPCSTNPCQNGGTCFVDGNVFKCSCPTSFFGTTCEKDYKYMMVTIVLVALVAFMFLYMVCSGCFMLRNIQKLKVVKLEQDINKYRVVMP